MLARITARGIAPRRDDACVAPTLSPQGFARSARCFSVGRTRTSPPAFGLPLACGGENGRGNLRVAPTSEPAPAGLCLFRPML